MDLTIPAAALAAAIAPLSRVIPARPAMPALAGVLLSADDVTGELTCTAFNGEIAATTTAEVAEITTGGSVLAPGALLASLAPKLPAGAMAHLSESSAGLLIECAGAHYDLGCEFGPDDFPATLSVPEDAARLGLSASALASAISFVAFAAAKDGQGRPVLEALCLTVQGNKAEVAALDGARMAIAPVAGGDGTGKVLLPTALVAELQRALTKCVGDDDAVEIEFSDSIARVILPDVTICGRLLDGEYPPYRKLMPKSHSREFRVNRDDLISAIERVTVIASQLEGTISLDLDEKSRSIHLRSENDRGSGVETLPVDVELGGELRIAMRGSFLMDAVKRLDGEQIGFHATNAEMPIRLSSDATGDDHIQIFVPMVPKQ